MGTMDELYGMPNNATSSWAPGPDLGDTPQPPGPPAGVMKKPAPEVMMPFLIGYFVCWVFVVILGLSGKCRKPWICGLENRTIKATRLTGAKTR